MARLDRDRNNTRCTQVCFLPRVCQRVNETRGATKRAVWLHLRGTLQANTAKCVSRELEEHIGIRVRQTDRVADEAKAKSEAT